MLSDIVNFIIKGLTVTIRRSLVWPAVRVDSFGWPAHRSRERRTWPRSSFHVPRSGTGTGTFREQFSVKILHKHCFSFRERSSSGDGSGNMATKGRPRAAVERHVLPLQKCGRFQPFIPTS